MPETSKIRVLIADDHPLFRDGMHGLLGSVAETEVVGEAATGDEAVALARTLSPDVILMDINMLGKNGIDATREILREHRGVGVLVVTMLEDDGSVFAAMRAGASGYVLKGAEQAEMLRAIRAVANGEVIFGPGIARRVMGFFSEPTPAAPPQAFPELSDRNGRSWRGSPVGAATRRSPANSSSASRRCRTTSPTSSGSCKSPTAPRPSSAPGKRAWEGI
jgi:DNA-binding NarL/FixJ family response regulator